MKIYISGAITNNHNYKEDFERAEDYLQREYPSADIINPALVNSCLPKSTTHEEYMRMSFCMLDMADSIYMLSNYENSKRCVYGIWLCVGEGYDNYVRMITRIRT